MEKLYIDTSSALMDIEAELHRLNLWSQTPPSAEAFASEQPFCIDTMEFPEWIQYVFLPRMHDLLSNHAPLPEACQIAPMAEVYFSERGMNCRALLGMFSRVDELLNAPR